MTSWGGSWDGVGRGSRRGSRGGGATRRVLLAGAAGAAAAAALPVSGASARQRTSGAASAAPEVAARRISSPDGSIAMTVPNGVNSRGQVIGVGRTPDEDYRSVFWDGERLTAYPAPAGHSSPVYGGLDARLQRARRARTDRRAHHGCRRALPPVAVAARRHRAPARRGRPPLPDRRRAQRPLPGPGADARRGPGPRPGPRRAGGAARAAPVGRWPVRARDERAPPGDRLRRGPGQGLPVAERREHVPSGARRGGAAPPRGDQRQGQIVGGSCAGGNARTRAFRCEAAAWAATAGEPR